MTLQLAVALVIASVIGFLTVLLLWPVGRPARPELLAFRIVLGLGVGQGITACLVFIFLVVHGRADGSYVFCEIVLLLVLVGLYALARRSKVAPTLHVRSPGVVASVRYGWLLAIACCVAVVAALAAIGIGMDRVPYGDWDAWGVYNLRARSIYRGGYEWRDNFSVLLFRSHPDYPLLLPLSVVRAWIYAGGETMAAPRLIGWAFIVATMGLVPSALAVLRGRDQACIAGVVLLGNAFLLRHASSQYADVPLTFFYAAAVALLVLYAELAPEQGAGSLTLAGLAAGLAAWTKNEGVLFVVALIAVHCAVVARTSGWREYAAQILPFAGAMLPALAIVVYFKLTLAPPSDLVSLTAGSSVSGKLMDPRRYFVIASELMQRAPLYEGFPLGMVYALAIYAYCAGIGARRTAGTGAGRTAGIAQATLILLLLYAGYFAAYVITPYDLRWHIATSMDRLLVQMWPTFVFTYFLVVGAPQEMFRSGIGVTRNPAR